MTIKSIKINLYTIVFIIMKNNRNVGVIIILDYILDRATNVLILQ